MKRIGFRLLLFLLLGAILNIAVAWGCSWFGPKVLDRRIFRSRESDAQLWRTYAPVQASRAPGVYSYSTGRGVELLELAGARPPNSFSLSIDARGEVTGSRDTMAAELQLPHSVFADRLLVCRAGWPIAVLEGCRTQESNQIGRDTGGRYSFSGGTFLDGSILSLHPPDSTARLLWALPFERNVDGKTVFRILPFRPLWPGFAINTIFYAVILWLPFATFGRIRRRRRIKRGLCPACAYPIGTSGVCTECGQRIGIGGAGDRV